MPLDANALRRRSREVPSTADPMCRAQFNQSWTLATGSTPLTPGRTQEAVLFAAVALEAGRNAPVDFVNPREPPLVQ